MTQQRRESGWKRGTGTAGASSWSRKEATSSAVHVRVEHTQERALLHLQGDAAFTGIDAGRWLSFSLLLELCVPLSSHFMSLSLPYAP